MMKKILAAALSVLLLSMAMIFGFANQVFAQVTTTFSFASDTFHQGPTFKGEKNVITSEYEFDLMVDLNSDTYGGLVTYLTRMHLKAEMYDYCVYPVGPQFLHVWRVYADIVFTHVNANAGDPPILGIACKEAVLTSLSPSPYTIGETMTLQDSESADRSIIMTAYPLLSGIGVKPELLSISEDFAFTFTNVRSSSDLSPYELVKVDKEGNLLGIWIAEGSFSASAYYPK
jgi:hypothetical protein